MTNSFNYDTTGVSDSGFEPLPNGDYNFIVAEVKEGVSKKNNYPQVRVVLETEHDGVSRKIWHSITFIPPTELGAGIAKHWLKCIGQPFEGKIIVNPQKWIGKRVKCAVGLQKNDPRYNEIKTVYMPELSTDMDNAANADVPF